LYQNKPTAQENKQFNERICSASLGFDIFFCIGNKFSLGKAGVFNDNVMMC